MCLSKSSLFNPESIHKEISALKEAIHHTYQTWQVCITKILSNGPCSYLYLQLEIQMRTNTLVLRLREEYRIGVAQHTDALVDLVDGMEQIKHLLSRAPRHSQLSHSRVQGARVSHQGLNFPLQPTWAMVCS